MVCEVMGVVRSYADSGAEELDEKTELVADLGIDSLGVMEIVADIEDKLELTIDDAELQGVTTLGDVVAALEERLRKDGKLEE